MNTIAVSRIHGCGSTFDDAGMVPFRHDHQIEFFEDDNCPSCAPKRQAQAKRIQGDHITGKLADARAAEETAGHEPLSASPKQTNWAPQIRMDLAHAAFEALGLNESDFNTRAGNPAGPSCSTTWQIDRLDLTPDRLHTELVKYLRHSG